MSIASPGDCLASCTAFTNLSADVSATALTDDVELCAIPKTVFIEMAKKEPSIMKLVATSVCNDLAKLRESLMTMSSLSVRERVARTLCELFQKFPQKSAEGDNIDLNITRSDLASLSGTVVESAVRHLSDFSREGLIALRGRTITILDYEKLGRIGRLMSLFTLSCLNA